MVKKLLDNINYRLALWVLAPTLAVGLLAGLAYYNLYGLGEAPAQNGLLPASIGKLLDTPPGNILVKFKSGTPTDQQKVVLAKRNLKEKSELKNIGVKLVSLAAGQSAYRVANELMSFESNYIEYAEPDYSVAPSLIPNDPWYENWQKDKQQLNSALAWDITTGSGDLILAIVDTGIDCGHEDLAGRCTDGWNFYDNNNLVADVHGHGTSVAGVAAAIGNNGVGIAGVTWQSKIMPLRVSSPDGSATYSAIAEAIVYAADHGAKVVNNSYQTSGSATVRSAGGYLKSKGGLLVVSEGNYGADTGYTNSPNLISVSAVDAGDTAYSWSSFGEDVDVSAPGCTGATTTKDGGYSSFCGTSNSAPEVSGILMLIWSVKPNLIADEAQDILFRSAKDLGTAGWDHSYGWGRVDAKTALDLVVGGGIINSSPTIIPTITEKPKPTPRGKKR